MGPQGPAGQDADLTQVAQMIGDGDAATLDAAKNYADAGDAATLDAAKDYADAGDAATLDAANGYADAGDAATLDAAKGYADAGDAATLDASKSYTDGKTAATLASANAHAEAGDAATLTASKSYTDTKATQALASANAYTDQRFAAWNDSFTQYQQQVDLRFAQTDRRIDQLGAMSGAMTSAAINTAGLPGQNRVGVGVGVQNGRSAIAIGYQRMVRPNASVSVTGAFSSGESSVSAGAGFSW